MTAIVVDTNTAAAETSLAIFASFFISGETRSTIDSITVFISSIMRTKDMVMKRIIHSAKLNFKISARKVVARANEVWTLKFGSFLKASLSPDQA